MDIPPPQSEMVSKFCCVFHTQNNLKYDIQQN